MKKATFAVAGLQIVLLILFAIGSGGSDPAGNAMSAGLVTLGGIIMAVLLIPALILAINNKAETLSVALSGLSLIICLFILTM